jgi:tetratricopeptide (TPR) repeat protein
LSQLSKYLSLVIVALLFQSKGFCKNIDSLKIALKNAKHDTTRCNIYYNLGKGLYIEQPDSAILFWGKVKEISENKLKESDILKKWYLKKLGKAFNGLGTVYQNLGDIAKSLDYYHKSLKACEQNQDKEGASTALNSIGGTYYNQGDLSNALEYWNRSLALYLEIGERSGIAMALTNIGVVYKRQNNISKALTY